LNNKIRFLSIGIGIGILAQFIVAFMCFCMVS